MVSERQVVSLLPERAFGALALEYFKECKRSNRKPNALLFKRLDFASAAYQKGEPIELVCIGSEHETFLQRLQDADLLVLLQALHNKQAKLQSLNLSIHCLSDETGELLSRFASVVEPLKALRLKSNLFSGAGAESLCAALAKCPSLTLLDLSLNKLGKTGGKAVAQLCVHLKNLKALDVSDCEIDLEGLLHLTTAVQDENKSLEILNIANPAVSFSDQHYFHIAGILKLCTNLRQLELAKLSLRDDGVEVIAPFLLGNKTLKSLGLACNQITWRSAAALGRVLSASTPLEFLDLCCNRLGDSGIQSLSAGLASNNTLKALLLNRNQITSKGLPHLADALSLNYTLKFLAIWENPFDIQSISLFAQTPPHFLRVEPLLLDFAVYHIDGQPHAAPNFNKTKPKAAPLPDSSTL